MRAKSAGGAVGSLNQVEPGREVQVEAPQWNRVKIGQRRVLESMNGLLGRPGGDESGGLGGVDEALGAEIVGVSVAGALAGEHTNTAAGAGSLASRFDDLLVDAERGSRNRFKVKVGVIAAGGESFAQAAFE